MMATIKNKKPTRMKNERCYIGGVGGGKRILVIASRPLNLSMPPSEPSRLVLNRRYDQPSPPFPYHSSHTRTDTCETSPCPYLLRAIVGCCCCCCCRWGYGQTKVPGKVSRQIICHVEGSSLPARPLDREVENMMMKWFDACSFVAVETE